jgi:hypothetical protein
MNNRKRKKSLAPLANDGITENHRRNISARPLIHDNVLNGSILDHIQPCDETVMFSLVFELSAAVFA